MKTKRYNGEEGSEVEFESKQGKSSIGDDVRARAMASVADLDKPDDSPAGKSGYGEQHDLPETKAKPKTKSFKTKAKEAGFTSAETKGGAALMYRKDRGSSYTPPAKSRPKKASRSSSEASMTDVIGAKKGGLMSSASKRADGCAMRGKTRGRIV
jgi:hypothetical protein